MTDRPGLDFSFSGLKTHTLNTVAECTVAGEISEQDKCDIALAFEEAVVATLVSLCFGAGAKRAAPVDESTLPGAKMHVVPNGPE